MNINRYRQILNEQEIKHFSAEELIGEYRKRKRKKRQALCLTFCLLAVILFAAESLRLDPFVPVTVYAADGNHIDLSDEVTSSRLDANVSYIFSSEAENTDEPSEVCLNFHFNEENIDTIALSCSDTEITRSNRTEHPAFFVENRFLDHDSYLQMKSEYESNENFLWMLSNGTSSVVTLLLGSTCTIPYDGQEDRQYGIVLTAQKTGDSVYSIDETVIQADIVFENGKTVRQKIKISACDDILKQGIELSLLK